MEHLIENENLIFLPFVILIAIVLILAVIAWFQFRKLEKGVQPDDDFPGRYEEAERPYIKMY